MPGRKPTSRVLSPFALRMSSLTATMLIMFAAVAWLAHRTWRQSEAIRDQIQSLQKVSAWLGNKISDTVHVLDTRMLRAKLGASRDEWPQFQNELATLQAWLSDQSTYLNTPAEADLLRLLHAEMEGYAAAARTFAAASEPIPVSESTAIQVTELSHRSKALVGLALELANTHQGTVNEVLDAASRASTQIQWMTFAVLGAMLAIATGMAWVVYRDSIAPLHQHLQESRHQLARQEKLAALGELAAGIAHEIRNPLTAVKARLFTLRKSVAHDEAATEDASMINGEIDRLERIVRNVLRFARPPEPVFAVVETQRLLAGICDLVQPEFAAGGVTLALDESTAPAIRADRDLIEQAMLNLAQNAAQAIVDSGRPGHVRLRASLCDHPHNGRRAAAVRLEVHDDGPGIPLGAQKRLFDPFFTTKANGTGLGLALTARIVEKHAGRVECRSTPGVGTTFALILPIE